MMGLMRSKRGQPGSVGLRKPSLAAEESALLWATKGRTRTHLREDLSAEYR